MTKTAAGTTCLASIVVDSNVVLKWFLADEAGREQAIRLRDAIVSGELGPVAPSHLPLELAAGLVRAARRGRQTTEAVLPALDALARMEFELVDVASVTTQAAALALSLGLSVYDAAYLVVGADVGAPLVTADAAVYQAASRGGHDVVWLADLPIGRH